MAPRSVSLDASKACRNVLRSGEIRYGHSLLACLVVGIAWSVERVQAQSIAPEVGPNGTGTLVAPSGLNPNQLDIQGGRLSGDRANLFHSLQRFGLNQGEIANFISQPQIRNILTRVVGGDPSYINGIIQVTGGNSNLYLMNPAGILFSTTATVNVPASFTATTATGIGFGTSPQDLRWFSATGANDYASLNGIPTTLAFTVSQASPIVNLATIVVGTADTVPGTSTLTMVGGTVATAGDLTAISGRQQIRLAAVAGQKLVQLVQNQQGLWEWNLLEASTATTQPQPWTLPSTDLPRLLTGGNVGQATRLQVNTDGTLELRVETDGTVAFVVPDRPAIGNPTLLEKGIKFVIEPGLVTLIDAESKIFDLATTTAQVEPFNGVFGVDGTLTNYLLFPAFANKCAGNPSCFPATLPPISNTSRILYVDFSPLLKLNTFNPGVGPTKTRLLGGGTFVDAYKCDPGCKAPGAIIPISAIDPRTFDPFQGFPAAATAKPGTPSPQPASGTASNSAPLLQPGSATQINTVLNCNAVQDGNQSGSCSRSNQPIQRNATPNREAGQGDRILQVIDGGVAAPPPR